MEVVLKKRKGITLIALVITVIILLIIAGVTVAVVNSNDLLKGTISAKKEYNKSSAAEKLNVKLTNLNIITIYDTGEVAKLTDLPKIVDTTNEKYYDKDITDVAITETVGVIKMDGYTFTVDNKLRILYIDGELANKPDDGGGSGGNNPSDPEQGIETPGSVSNITVKLSDGMIPVKWDEGLSVWIATTTSDKDWFSYTAQEGTVDGKTSKWANVMLRDGLVVEGIADPLTASIEEMNGKKITSNGSMFVWIPRYAYKIESEYHNGGSGVSGKIDVKFLNTNNTYKDGSSTSTLLTNPLNSLLNASTNYVVHPAFTWEDESGKKVELEGIWVAKFEASNNNGNVAVKPDITSWRAISINNIFTNCRNMEASNIYGWKAQNGLLQGDGSILNDSNNFDTHFMKNVEWGAVAYLAHSKYGRNGTEISMNNSSSYLTGSGSYKANTTQSTTGNIYGVYDLSGGCWEAVAAHVNNNNSVLNAGASKLKNAKTKYKDVYEAGYSDNSGPNYSKTHNKYGDAIFETSGYSCQVIAVADSYSSVSWFADHSYFIAASYPILLRGGSYQNGAGAGTFSFNYSKDVIRQMDSFRAVITVI